MDWADIKNEYICSDISYRALADRHEVSESTLMQRAAREKWKEQRDKHRSKVEAKTRQKAAKKQSDARAAIADTKERIRLKLWKTTERSLDEMCEQDTIDTADLRRVEQIYCDLISSDASLPTATEDNAAGIIQIPAVDLEAFERMKQEELKKMEMEHE